MSTAVYAGTFDPPTLGHLAVIRAGARLFSHVRVIVAQHPTKVPLFSLEERVELVRKAVSRLSNVTVDATSGLVVDYARDIGATVLVPAEEGLVSVSSSELKARALAGEDARTLCPPGVWERLIEQLAARREG